MNVGDASELLKMFSGKKMVVIGDLVADEYVYGTTSRISREAPILIVREDDREIRPGGAANVVANIKAMGGDPLPVGLVGDDATGRLLVRTLENSGVDCSGIIVEQDRFTTTKTRVLAGGINTVRQQMIRLDRLNTSKVSHEMMLKIETSFVHACNNASAVVVSDYGEGVVGKSIVNTVCRMADGGENIFVDSRFHVDMFHGVSSLVPNEPELAAAAGFGIHEPEALERAGRWLLEKTESKAVLLKRGRNGMALFQPGVQTRFQGSYGSDEVADVTGAGDTVLAAWSLACVAGVDVELAMKIANVAGGIKVGKSGTAVVRSEELLAALKNMDL